MFKCGVCRDSIRQSAGPPFDRDMSRVDSGRFPIFEASYSSVTCSSCPMRSARDVQNRTWIQIRSVPCPALPPAIASYLTKVGKHPQRQRTSFWPGKVSRPGNSHFQIRRIMSIQDNNDPGFHGSPEGSWNLSFFRLCFRSRRRLHSHHTGASGSS
jgi:hypothetical protein